MTEYTASEMAYKNGYKFGKNLKFDRFWQQFVKGLLKALEEEDNE